MYKTRMTPKQLNEYADLVRCVKGNEVVHTIKGIALEGAPGMGKTACIRAIAKRWEQPCITVSINQWVNAADIVAYSYKGYKDDLGNFELAGEDEIPPWLPVYRIDPTDSTKRVKTTDATKGYKVWRDKKTGQYEAHPAVILLDEFSAARPSVQAAFLCVSLDRVVKNFKLDNDTTFFVAFNSCERAGFEMQNNEISDALVGPNGRFDCIELIFEAKAVIDCVQANPNISTFWKMFTKKVLKSLKLVDDNDPNDYNSCGRTWENLMILLSNGNFDSKNFPSFAEMLVKMNFATSEKLATQVITAIKNFDIPTGEDFLNGTAEIKTFSDAIIAVNAIGITLGFRKKSNEQVISMTEQDKLHSILDAHYPTGMKHADGTPIIGSNKELYMVMKSTLLRENLENNLEFTFVADAIDNFDNEDNGNSSDENEEDIQF